MVLEPLGGTVLKGIPCETIGSANYGKSPANYTRVWIARGHEAKALARLVITGYVSHNGKGSYLLERGVSRYILSVPIASQKSGRLIVYLNSIERLEQLLEEMANG